MSGNRDNVRLAKELMRVADGLRGGGISVDAMMGALTEFEEKGDRLYGLMERFKKNVLLAKRTVVKVLDEHLTEDVCGLAENNNLNIDGDVGYLRGYIYGVGIGHLETAMGALLMGLRFAEESRQEGAGLDSWDSSVGTDRWVTRTAAKLLGYYQAVSVYWDEANHSVSSSENILYEHISQMQKLKRWIEPGDTVLREKIDDYTAQLEGANDHTLETLNDMLAFIDVPWKRVGKNLVSIVYGK